MEILIVLVLLAVLIFLLPKKGSVARQMSPAVFFGLFFLILLTVLYFLNR